MLFQNPETKETKTIAMPMLAAFIVGPLYFLFTGMLVPGALWLALSIFLSFQIGIGAVLVSNLVCGALAPMLYRAHFRRRGWKEFKEGFIEEEVDEHNNPYTADKMVELTSSTGVPIPIHIERVLALHGAKKSAGGYSYQGEEYMDFPKLVEAINKKIST